MESLPRRSPFLFSLLSPTEISLSSQVHPYHWQSLRPLPVSIHLWETVHLCPSLYHPLVDFSSASANSVLLWCCEDTPVSNDSRIARPGTVRGAIFSLCISPLWGMYQVEAVLCWISCWSDDWGLVVPGCQDCLSYPQWEVDCWLWPWLRREESVEKHRWVCHGKVTEWSSEHFWLHD